MSTPVIHAIPSRARVNAAICFYPLSTIEHPTAVKWLRGSRVLSRRPVTRRNCHSTQRSCLQDASFPQRLSYRPFFLGQFLPKYQTFYKPGAKGKVFLGMPKVRRARLNNLRHACPKWQRRRFLWHAAIKAVPFFFNFFSPSSLSIL